MRVVIAGSRDITDYVRLCKLIERSGFEITEVVSGMARGVDRMGQRWAVAHGVPIKEMPANWEKYGKRRAGPIRNRAIAEYCDAGIILWDGKSPGTRDMMNQLRNRDLPFVVDIIEEA